MFQLVSRCLTEVWGQYEVHVFRWWVLPHCFALGHKKRHVLSIVNGLPLCSGFCRVSWEWLVFGGWLNHMGQQKRFTVILQLLRIRGVHRNRRYCVGWPLTKSVMHCFSASNQFGLLRAVLRQFAWALQQAVV